MDDRIRQAVEADIPRILEMGARSLAEGPYKDQIAHNSEAAALLALEAIRGHEGTILLYERDGRAVGLLAFFIFPHWFSGELTGHEVMWWVEPEHRRSFIAIALLRAAERMAREAGATRMQFTAPTEEVGRAYEALGYKKLEVGYQKELTCQPSQPA